MSLDEKLFAKKPLVAIFSEPNGLAINLVEILLSELCRVNIISENIEPWKLMAGHLLDNPHIKISRHETGVQFEIPDYSIFIPGYFGVLDDAKVLNYKDIELRRIKLFSELLNQTSNSIVVLPCKEFEYYFHIHEYLKENLKSNSRFVFLGEMVGPRITLSGKDPISFFIKTYLEEKKALIDQNMVTPIDIREGARFVVKQLFSFSVSGEMVSFKSKETHLKECIPYNIRQDELKNIKNPERFVHKSDKIISKEFDVASLIEKSIEWFGINGIEQYNERVLYVDVHGNQESIDNNLSNNINTFGLMIPTTQPTKISNNRSNYKTYEEQTTPVNKNRNLPKKLEILDNSQNRLHRIEDKNIIEKSNKKVNKIERLNRKHKENKSQYNFPLKRKYGYIFLTLISFLIVPYLLFAFVSSLTFYSYSQFTNSNFENSYKYFSYSNSLSRRSTDLAFYYQKIPIVSSIYSSLYMDFRLINELSDLGKETTYLILKIQKLGENMLSQESYDIESTSKEIKLGIESIVNKKAFLESELTSNTGSVSNKIKDYLLQNDTDELLKLASTSIGVLEELPDILGMSNPKKYLILFQNNMELRPTGGFIGSFALVSFTNGHLSDMNVLDVYSADGQLKGHVEPPVEIKNLLGEANWYLRDSNWEPDFTVSAERAEWFLDKEIQEKVDGVIAVDLEVVKDLIDHLGNVDISDYGKVVTSDNLYEITQNEAEKDFFPGSHQKASFLSALSNEVVRRIAEGKYNKLDIAKVFYDNLNQRHVQIYLHNTNAQKIVSSLNWDGAVKQPVCPNENCFSDWLGIAEANLGVNKANVFIERSFDVVSNISGNNIERKLVIRFRNNAPNAIDYAGFYKAHLRLMLPDNVYLESVEEGTGNSYKESEYEAKELLNRKDVGLLVLLKPQEEKQYRFKWVSKNNYSKNDPSEYRFYFRKQAGTSGDRFDMALINESEMIINPAFGLTDSNTYRYNTTLDEDVFVLAKW